MNTAIEQLKTVDAQLKALSSILSKGSYLGTGLVVSVNVGPLTDDCRPTVEDIQIGFSGEPQEMLELLVKSLAQSRAFWLGVLQSDLKKLQDAAEIYGVKP